MAKLFVAFTVVCALFAGVFGLVIVRGDGMTPTSGDGDVALTSRTDRNLVANDLVVYRSTSGQQLVGRVVAQPGDTVEVTNDGEFKVNGATQPSKAGGKTEPVESGPTYPLTLGDGEYFVLGDNRASAVDSRAVGPVGISGVEGKVIALLRLRAI